MLLRRLYGEGISSSCGVDRAKRTLAAEPGLFEGLLRGVLIGVGSPTPFMRAASGARLLSLVFGIRLIVSGGDDIGEEGGEILRRADRDFGVRLSSPCSLLPKELVQAVGEGVLAARCWDSRELLRSE